MRKMIKYCENCNPCGEHINDYIAITWHIDDITGINNNITKEQARDILYNVKKYHDAEYGVNWETIKTTMDIYLSELKEY